MADTPPPKWQDNLKIYEAVIALHPEIVRKGKANPYTSVNGHMFSFLNKEGDLGFRLSKEDRKVFLEEHNTQLIVSYNTIMKEYVQIPDTMLDDQEALLHYLSMSYDYVKSLKPKPTTKKKK